MSEENEDITGYITASEYAAIKELEEFKVIKQIKTGLLPGRVIGTSWYVKSDLVVPNNAAEISAAIEARGAEEIASIEASEKAQNEYKKSIKPVKVVGLEIPFGDVMWLTVQGACASLIIALPLGLLLVVINS